MTITEAFDIREDLIGEKVGKVVVKNINEIQSTLAAEEIDVVILTTPESVAQQVADQLVEAGGKVYLTLRQAELKHHKMYKFTILIWVLNYNHYCSL